MKNTSNNHTAAMKTFSDRVVELALMVPAGKVTTYGLIARAAGGGSMASRSITGILGKAYKAGEKNIPFHRIVYSDGRAWFDSTHEAKRRALYKKEGIQLDKKGRIEDFRDKLFEFK
ncbi:MAG TPA: MGMT family protein [Candidatus Paceibacterota bacterium]|nr:MGMT family protein [Candidatus Paceibacterota bacterium]